MYDIDGNGTIDEREMIKIIEVFIWGNLLQESLQVAYLKLPGNL